MHKKRWFIFISAAFIAAAITSALSGCSDAEKNRYVNPDITADITYTFSNDSVSSEASDKGSISGTSVIISAPGTYAFTGECDDGSILVSETAGDVTLILNSLELSSKSGAPIKLEGSFSNTTITAAEGTTNTLADTDRSQQKPKSVINADGNLTLNGTGTLNIIANNKNAVKTDTNLLISDVSLIINSVDHGICADGTLTINSGNFYIVSDNDAIKSSPDEVSETLPASVLINGGDFTITSAGDAIASDNELTINGGTFNITSGSDTVSASSATSQKGLKAAENLTVYGGTFNIDSADDAVHSNNYIYILGGSFTVSTGDDAFHADTSLIVGKENGNDEDINIIVEKSGEGLEGGTVYVYSGTIDITSSDDGINAAGGDGSGQLKGNDNFNPGGGGGKGPAMNGAMRGGFDTARDGTQNDTSPAFVTDDADVETAQTPDSKLTPGEAPKNTPKGGASDRLNKKEDAAKSADSSSEMPKDGAQMPQDSEITGSMNENALPGRGSRPSDGAQNAPDMRTVTIPSESREDYAIYIYGGSIKVNAGGDGIDSNGNIYVYGGQTLIFGSENGSNAAIDYGDFGFGCSVSGGTLLAVGYSQMAGLPSQDSTLKYTAFTLPSELKSGDSAVIYNENQNAVFEFEAIKRANHVVFTSGEITEGAYTISVNGTAVSTYNVK